jgi:hypothetical protein
VASVCAAGGMPAQIFAADFHARRANPASVLQALLFRLCFSLKPPLSLYPRGRAGDADDPDSPSILVVGCVQEMGDGREYRSFGRESSGPSVAVA